MRRQRRLHNILRFWGRKAAFKNQPVFAICEEPELVQEKTQGHFPEEHGASNLMERLSGEMADLRRELAKLGKTQLRAQAAAESALETIKRTMEGLKAALDQRRGAPADAQSEALIKDLLMVADGLEEALNPAGTGSVEGGTESSRLGPNDAWIDGIRIIHRRVCEMLEKEHIRPIPSVGQNFDPHMHIAVGVEHTSEVPENVITEEQRKGYKRGNQVIRYAEVVVAKRAIKN